ncbi:MAG: imidazoleglycerol-phosphate dehydratase HisB [bacterium]
MSRNTTVERKTTETQVSLELNLDGKGVYEIDTSIPFMDHMLSLMCKHSFFNLKLQASGDIEVDYHHLVEDLGITIGTAFRQLLEDKRQIRRYGAATLPMDESLATVALDICSRSVLVYNVDVCGKIGDFDIDLVEEFFRAFVSNSMITLHINLFYGNNLHHIAEAIFKAFGRALSQATRIDPSMEGVLSTKGKL